MRSSRVTSWSRSERLERSSTMARSTGTSTLPPPPDCRAAVALRRGAGFGDEHLEVPHAGAVGRIEAHDQRRVLARDRTRPLLGARARARPRRACGCVERAAVEAGEERFGDVVAGAHDGRRRGHLDAARAVAADGVDHAGERGAGDGTRVDAGIERGDTAGHGVDDVGEPFGIDQRGRPAHRVRRVVAAGRAAPASSLAQHRHHRARAASSTAHIATLPNQRTLGPTSSRTSPEPAATSQPEHLAHRRAHRGGLVAAGHAHVLVRGPRRRGGFGVGEELRHLFGGGGGTPGATGPGDDPARVPTTAADARRRARWSRAPGGSGAGPGSGPGLVWPGLRSRSGGAMPGGAGRRSPVRRASASVRMRWTCSASATTWSRSSPVRRRAARRCSSASTRRRSSDARQAGLSASRISSCSGVARSSASSST